MDVLEIAKQRRASLEREIARLSEFIAMGEELSSNGRLENAKAGNGTARAEDGQPDQGGGSANTIRQFSAGNAAGAKRD